MAFFKKSEKQNYDVLSGFSWYVPGIGGTFTMLGLLLVGAILGNLVPACLKPLGDEVAEEYGTLIGYPVMFIPAMLYAKLQSMRNMAFETGYRLESGHFGRGGAVLTAVLCMVATCALSLAMDAVNSLMPKMPEALEEALKELTQGSFWLNFLSVSIFAPLFEEWLCRGTVLRGLLNHVRADGTRMKPFWAIVISALFFAVIHMNPWQAVPAFGAGCLLGYVYYRTGSLVLTMLMHFANNTMALILGQIDSVKDCESWTEILPTGMYWVAFTAAVIMVILFVRYINRIEMARPSGNSDEIAPMA
jgi:uncharacterized protein